MGTSSRKKGVLDPVNEASEPRLGRRERKKLEVHGRILGAAMDLFHEKGYEATTVEEIAERADVAKGTFFNYFPRKDALLEALAEETLERVEAELGAPETWTGSGREQIERIFLRFAELSQRDPELSKVMVIETMRNFWLRTEDEPIHQAYRAFTRGVLQRAQLRNEFRSEADIEIAVKLLEAAYVTTMVEWLKEGGSGEAMRAELLRKFDIIFRGIGYAGSRQEGGEE